MQKFEGAANASGDSDDCSALRGIHSFRTVGDAENVLVASQDGVSITGQADVAAAPASGAVILVAGTNHLDRDNRFGRSGTPRDLIFADLGQRLTARGMHAIRYERRGVRYGVPVAEALNGEVSVTATTNTMRDDLGAIYNWARSNDGLGARCVVFFGHSEGMAHIGRLAESGALAPNGVIGMGAALESPAAGFRWRFAERDAYSLELMDVDGDGRTTNEEVRANLSRTPAAVNGVLAPYLHPTGAWDAEAIARVRQAQAAVYEQMRAMTLAIPDEAPYPNAQTPMSSYQWWKSWYLDDIDIAGRLAAWDVPMIFHYGTIDSQTQLFRERPAGERNLGARARFIVHDGLGHTLGSDAAYGPIQDDIADQMADEAAAMCRVRH